MLMKKLEKKVELFNLINTLLSASAKIDKENDRIVITVYPVFEPISNMAWITLRSMQLGQLGERMAYAEISFKEFLGTRIYQKGNVIVIIKLDPENPEQAYEKIAKYFIENDMTIVYEDIKMTKRLMSELENELKQYQEVSKYNILAYVFKTENNISYAKVIEPKEMKGIIAILKKQAPVGKRIYIHSNAKIKENKKKGTKYIIAYDYITELDYLNLKTRIERIKKNLEQYQEYLNKVQSLLNEIQCQI